jgi:hypothetical protein
VPRKKVRTGYVSLLPFLLLRLPSFFLLLRLPSFFLLLRLPSFFLPSLPLLSPLLTTFQLSGGAIAGIVIGALFVLVGLALVLYMVHGKNNDQFEMV